MLRRSTIPAFVLGAALLLAGRQAAHAASTAADQVTFRFAPPLDKTYLATSKVTTSRTTPRGKTRVNETEIASRVRASREGQRVLQTFSVISTVNRLDGNLIASPLLRVLPGRDLVYAVGADGQILELANFPALLDAVNKAQPERVEAAAPFLTAEALLARRRAAANPVVQGLVGKTLKVGEKTTFPGNVLLPTGEPFPVRFTATLKGREKTPDCDCVRVDFTTEPVPQTGKPPTVGAKGKGSSLIDPATMITWALQNEQAITLEEPGATTLMTINVTVDDALAPNR
jgi:hypothetical protein